MKDGSYVRVTDAVPEDLAPGVFRIRLLKEQLQHYPTSDVLLDINPQKNEIVLNTRTNGHWGHEVRIPNTYFKPGIKVTVSIFGRRGYYEIRVNDEFMYGFKFRSDDKPLYASVEGVSMLGSIQYHHNN